MLLFIMHWACALCNPADLCVVLGVLPAPRAKSLLKKVVSRTVPVTLLSVLRKVKSELRRRICYNEAVNESLNTL